jgi:hypothetical protein
MLVVRFIERSVTRFKIHSSLCVANNILDLFLMTVLNVKTQAKNTMHVY